MELELVIDMTRTPKQQEPLAPEELPAMVEVLVDMGPGQAAALVQVHSRCRKTLIGLATVQSASSKPASPRGVVDSPHIVMFQIISDRLISCFFAARRCCQVAIDQTEMQKKLYLGGFRNKKTGALYHHACTQTPRKPKYRHGIAWCIFAPLWNDRHHGRRPLPLLGMQQKG